MIKAIFFLGGLKGVARALRSWAQVEAETTRFRQVFKAVAPTRKTRRRVDNLARRLLVWHIMRGRTLDDLEEMVKR